MSEPIRRIMTSARNSNVDELDRILKRHNLTWYKCCFSTGDTPLHVAAKGGKVDVLRYLLESLEQHELYVDVRNASGKTALHEACQNAEPEAVGYLLAKGANCRSIKQADWTPLMLACTRTGPQALTCCLTLIEKGGVTLLKDRNKDGWNALHIAVREGDSSVVRALLKEDSSQVLIVSKNGRTPLHTSALHGCCEVTQLLLDCGLIDKNAQDSCGSTPVHEAVRSGNMDTLRVLLESGANVDDLNFQHYGVLHMAAEVGQDEMLKFLCKDAKLLRNINAKNSSTPLHCAVRSGNINAAEVLLQYGADPFAKDANGWTSYDLIPRKIRYADREKLQTLLKSS